MEKKKIKKIAFFTAGFAYNRLVRMIFYEQILPKDVEIYLITTDKYESRESSIPQEDYKLARTKVVKLHYDWKLAIRIRKFCNENKIDRLINLGFHSSVPLLFLSIMGTKTDLAINVLVDIFKQHYITNTYYEKFRDLAILPMLSIFGRLANKMYFTDPLNAERAPKFFMMDKKKLIFLAAPINTEFFVPQNKEIARKKLKFRKDEKIILYVGRANYLRCSDILIELIKNNKEYNFVIVGPIHDPELKKIKTKNLIHIEKLPQDKLLDYYAASDLVFCLNRGGGGIGISSEEALACGRPIILSNQFRAKKEKGIYQINTNYEEAQNSIKQYFSLSDKEKTNISKLVRKYAEKNYSYDIWKNKYIEAYLH